MRFKFFLPLLILLSFSFILKSQELEANFSPYQTVYTHLFYLQENSYEPEKSATTIYGDFSNAEKIKIAIKIKKVLDGKGLFIDMDAIPINKNYKDSSTNKSVYYLSHKENLIFLEKIEDSWYYSNTTIVNVDNLYNEVFPFWTSYIDYFISYKFSTKKILTISLGQYFTILFLIFFSVFLFYLVKKIALFIIKKAIGKSSNLPKEILREIAKVLSLLITFFFIQKVIPSVQLPLKLSIFLILVTNIFLILFLTIFISKIFKIIVFYLEKVVAKTETKLDNQLLPILSKMGNLIIYFVALLYILKELNINITALLAGLSIGGLALALASKDTVQNVIGSLNIFLDRPFEIGDYIKINGAEGIVEEVGLRATRIRTLNQSLAYIPNGNLSNMTIDNYGLRIYRRWKTTFGLDYDTSPEKIELFITETVKILNGNQNTLNEKSLVYFTNLGEFTLDIYLSVFFDVKTFKEDMQCKQDILLAILKMAKKNEIEFAFPTRTIYSK